MKILMVNKFLYPNGGSETYIFKLGEYLVSQGHEVQYFGMEHEGRCVGNAVNAYTEEMDFHEGGMLSKIAYPIKTIYSMEAREKIRKVLNDFRPDVVHLNNITYQLTPSIILEIVDWRRKAGKRCRIVYTAHDSNLVCPNHLMRNPNTGELCRKCLGGHFWHCAEGKCIHGSAAKSAVGTMEGYYWKIRGTYQYIDAVICPSKFMKKILSSDPVLAQKSIVLHNFAEKAEWKGFDAEAGGVPKKEYVLYFGRFSEEKGIRTLARVCRKLPQVHFIFAGSGPLEGEIEGLENGKNVGFQSGGDLERLIREARFSVFPSEWYENCPLSVIESLMYGTPVLGAEIGGIPELIDAGKTGELFESGNGRELQEKILKLWNDQGLCMKYAENCRDIHFDSVEEYSRKLMKIYTGRLKRKKKTAAFSAGAGKEEMARVRKKKRGAG